MRAIVVRHYKTLINASGEIMGWGNAPPIKGWEEDLAAVNVMLSEHAIRFIAVYSSGLERARRTGMYYARNHGIPVIRDCIALNEVNYGALYRKKKSWVAETYPLHKKDPDFVYPEGESFRQMQSRSVHFLESLAEKRRGDTILVVVHAGVIRGFISHFLGLPYGENLKRKVTHRYIGDFQFEGKQCVRYDELGKPSGFVKDGIISIPVEKSALNALAAI